jgi:tryptophan synthase beta chain
MAVTDADALIAAVEVSRMEGIIPALETAHAFSVLKDLDLKPTDRVVINLSGRGDKDMNTYMEELNLL